MEHDPELTAHLADILRAAVHRQRLSDPDAIAAYVLAELIPSPFVLAGSLDALPAKLHDDLPPGTIESLCELIPHGDETLSVYRMHRRKRERDG